MWGFNFSKKKDQNGEMLEVDTSTEKGWMNVPNHFKCNISVRSSKHADLINKTFADAEAKGMEYEFRKK